MNLEDSSKLLIPSSCQLFHSKFHANSERSEAFDPSFVISPFCSAGFQVNRKPILCVACGSFLNPYSIVDEIKDLWLCSCCDFKNPAFWNRGQFRMDDFPELQCRAVDYIELSSDHIATSIPRQFGDEYFVIAVDCECMLGDYFYERFAQVLESLRNSNKRSVKVAIILYANSLNIIRLGDLHVHGMPLSCDVLPGSACRAEAILGHIFSQHKHTVSSDIIVDNIPIVVATMKNLSNNSSGRIGGAAAGSGPVACAQAIIDLALTLRSHTICCGMRLLLLATRSLPVMLRRSSSGKGGSTNRVTGAPGKIAAMAALGRKALAHGCWIDIFHVGVRSCRLDVLEALCGCTGGALLSCASWRDEALISSLLSTIGRARISNSLTCCYEDQAGVVMAGAECGHRLATLEIRTNGAVTVDRLTGPVMRDRHLLQIRARQRQYHRLNHLNQVSGHAGYSASRDQGDGSGSGIGGAQGLKVLTGVISKLNSDVFAATSLDDNDNNFNDNYDGINDDCDDDGEVQEDDDGDDDLRVDYDQYMHTLAAVIARSGGQLPSSSSSSSSSSSPSSSKTTKSTPLSAISSSISAALSTSTLSSSSPNTWPGREDDLWRAARSRAVVTTVALPRMDKRCAVTVQLLNKQSDTSSEQQDAVVQCVVRFSCFMQVADNYNHHSHQSNNSNNHISSNSGGSGAAGRKLRSVLHKVTRVCTIRQTVTDDITEYLQGLNEPLWGLCLCRGLVADYHDASREACDGVAAKRPPRSDTEATTLSPHAIKINNHTNYREIHELCAQHMSNIVDDWLPDTVMLPLPPPPQSSLAATLSSSHDSGNSSDSDSVVRTRRKRRTPAAVALALNRAERVLYMLYLLTEGPLLDGPAMQLMESYLLRARFLTSSIPQAYHIVCPAVLVPATRASSQASPPPAVSAAVMGLSLSCDFLASFVDDNEEVHVLAPSTTSLIPNVASLVDCGDVLIIRRRAALVHSNKNHYSSAPTVSHSSKDHVIDNNKQHKHGRADTGQADEEEEKEEEEEEDVKMMIDFASQRAHARSPSPAIIGPIRPYTSLDRLVFSRLEPAHMDCRDTQLLNAPWLGDLTAAQWDMMVSSAPFTDQRSFTMFLFSEQPRFAQMLQAHKQHLLTAASAVVPSGPPPTVERMVRGSEGPEIRPLAATATAVMPSEDHLQNVL